MSRILAVAVAVLLFAVSTAVQAQAPAVHPGTKLAFGPTIGNARFENSGHAASSPGGRGVADTYIYSVGKMQITVDIFDGGRRVPAGSTNPTVAAQFETEVTAAEAQIKASNYTRFERPTVPSTCNFGATTFRCIVYSAQGGGTRLYSKVMLTGYNGYFVKISIIWSVGDRNTITEADQALNNFVPALMR
jgi:hypothetical protein